MVGHTKLYQYEYFMGIQKLGHNHHDAEGDRMCPQPHTINLYRHWVATSAAAVSD